MVLRRDVNSVIKGYESEDLGKYGGEIRGEIVAIYDDFPRDEGLYIEAQNQKDFGVVAVYIIVDG